MTTEGHCKISFSEWAEMSSQEAQEYGGEQRVHEFMLSELTVAARVAGQLQGKA